MSAAVSVITVKPVDVGWRVCSSVRDHCQASRRGLACLPVSVITVKPVTWVGVYAAVSVITVKPADVAWRVCGPSQSSERGRCSLS